MNTLLGKDLRAFARWVALALAFYSVAPFLWGLFLGSDGGIYLPYQTNFDDHMVYAAWMKQAQQGQFLFSNRFTADPQPGLTIHLFFLVLGWLGALVGTGWATVIARVGLSFVMLDLLARLVDRLDIDLRAKKLGVIFATFGAGLGAIFWEPFGTAMAKPTALGGLISNRLPIDTWQPEAFLFSSSLTNALFVASFCLILGVLLSVVSAKESSKLVPLGAGCMFLLMNIHSYDVLIVGFVMIGLCISCGMRGELDKKWVGRCLAISAGMLPSAAWFAYVFSTDQVFRARAAVPTYAPSFQQLLWGIAGLVVLGAVGIYAKSDRRGRPFGVGLLALLCAGLFAFSNGKDTNQFLLTLPIFGLALVFAYVSSALAGTKSPDWNMWVCWGCIGLVLPYVPVSVQRKFAMGLAVPWGVLAAVGASALAEKLGQPVRRYALGALSVVLCSSSLMWLSREFLYVQNNVSSTTMHPVLFSKDVAEILSKLRSEKNVIAAAPVGIPNRVAETGFMFGTPIMPDLNPVLTAEAGVRTYAGHWGETPNYPAKRAEIQRIFLRGKQAVDKVQAAKQLGLTHLVVPNPEKFPQLPLEDLRGAGTELYKGEEFSLIRI